MPTACRTIMSSMSASMATASGRPPRTVSACIEKGKWKIYRTQDGLAHRAVLGVAADPGTGVVWAATMGGLSRLSAGALREFHPAQQRSSQRCASTESECRATTYGSPPPQRRPPRHAHRPVGALQRAQHADATRSGLTTSSVGTEQRSTTRSGAAASSEYDVKTGHWKDYNDPDGETEMVGQKDQGLIHEITTSVSYVEKDKILCGPPLISEPAATTAATGKTSWRRTAACPAISRTR